MVIGFASELVDEVFFSGEITQSAEPHIVNNFLQQAVDQVKYFQVRTRRFLPHAEAVVCFFAVALSKLMQ